MAVRVLVTCVVATASAGCELVFVPHGAAGDAPIGPADANDADTDTDADTARGPFSPPVQVSIMQMLPADGYVSDPTLTEDESQLAFIVTEPPNVRIRIAFRGSGPTTWETPVTPGFDSAALETNPKFLADGTELWFARGSAAVLPDIVAYHRAAPNSDTWSDATGEDAAGLTTTMDERPGTPTADALHMIIHRKTVDTPMGELLEYERASAAAPWTQVAGTTIALNAVGPTNNAHLAGDGLTVVFAAQVGGQTDLFIATRTALGQTFSPPTEIAEVNDPVANDGDPWLSRDGQRLWFSRTIAPSVTPAWGIYFSERTP
jgi:hypothetical protein